MDANMSTKSMIIIITTAIIIGNAAVTFVKSLVADLVMPILFKVFSAGTGSNFAKKFLADNGFKYMHFVAELVSFIVMVLVVWMLYVVVKKISVTKTVSSLMQEEFFFDNIAKKPSMLPLAETKSMEYEMDEDEDEKEEFVDKKTPMEEASDELSGYTAGFSSSRF